MKEVTDAAPAPRPRGCRLTETRDNCPECGEPYDEPQNDNFVCGDCAFQFVLQKIAASPDLASKTVMVQID